MQKENQPYNIQPADRLANVSEYYFSRKLKEVARMNAEGKDVISLGIGSPDMPPSEETINVLCENAKKPDVHGYQPTVGIPELRRAMADWYKRWYNVDLNPDTEIQPLIGSKEGILHVTLALVNPGDQVLVPNPGYPTYTSLNKILGSEIVNYNLREDNHWQPDFDELERMDLSRVKIMWTNYPNMPTGANATLELYQKLVDFARRHNIVIVNDNPYSFILNRKPISILNIEGAKECCIEFNSMSKSHNMPGWRVGMIATNATFIQWILKIKSNIDSGTFRPLQLAAAQAYRNSAEWHEEANYTPPEAGRGNHARLGLHVRPRTGRHVPVGENPRHVCRCGRPDRKGIARSPCIHHPRIHLRKQRETVYPHLALRQRREAGGSPETYQSDNSE